MPSSPTEALATNIRTYMVVLFGAMLGAVVLTPVVVRFARRINAVDAPGVRKVHAREIPRLGGIAIVLATMGITLPVFALNNDIGAAFRTIRLEIAVFLATAFLIFLLGLLDDLWGLSPKAKFVGQFLAAAAVCGSGVAIDQIAVKGEVYSFGWFAIPLTIFWIVGITNAVNLIDGLDGLAAGISLITCAVITAVAIYAHHPVMAVLMLALSGSLTGFLIFNFNPARIFLGDCGSLFLGFVLATSSVLTSHKATTVVALAVPVLALGVPIFDTLLSMVRRLLGRRSMFAPDREHIHHRLLDQGFNHRKVVLMLYGVTAGASVLGLLMMFARDFGQVLLAFLAVGLLLFAFRASGVLSVSQSIRMLRRNQQLARDVSSGRDLFERSLLRLHEGRGTDDWWQAVTEGSASSRSASSLPSRGARSRPASGSTPSWRTRSARSA